MLDIFERICKGKARAYDLTDQAPLAEMVRRVSHCTDYLDHSLTGWENSYNL